MNYIQNNKYKMDNEYSILQVCVDLDGGGIDRYLYNYCTRINGIHFDFAAVESKHGILERPLAQRGFGIYHVPRLSKGILKNFRALKKIMKQNKYDAIHVHLGYYSIVALLCAKICGIKTRIVHAHVANAPMSLKDNILKVILTPITKHLATNLAACGVDAAKWVWGRKTYSLGKVTIHNNAIDTSLYAFSMEVRHNYRLNLCINENCLVVGHVGRFSEQKNQKRLLSIFNEIHKLQPNSILLLIGREDPSYDVQDLITRYKLNDYVKCLGVKNDVGKILNAVDVFVFPSKYEGLPFTLIETQCNGLPSICSTNVTPDAKCSDSLLFMPLSENDKEWAIKAIELAQKGHNANAINDVINAGYDICIEATKLKRFYKIIIQEHV